MTALMLAFVSVDPSLACSPMLDPPPLLDTEVKDVAARLIERSAVIVDGTIEWTSKGWKARSMGWGRSHILRLDLFPMVRVDHALKGAPRTAYKVVDTEDCGGGTDVANLPSGTHVRLLLEPLGVVDGTELWSPISTSWDNTRSNERRINAAIDVLLARRRDARAVLLATEPPPPE